MTLFPLLGWTLEGARSSTLEVVVGRLYHIEPFVHLLADHGLCSRDAAVAVRERPDLLVHLQSRGPLRFLTQIEPCWERHLADFAGSLRGLCIRYQVQLLHTAREFAARLPAGPLEPSAWESLPFDWLDELLRKHTLETVRSHFMPGLDRFIDFLIQQGEGDGHPLRRWREKQSGWVDALRRRQQGAPPQPRQPRFRSFLARQFEGFLEYKRNLGRKGTSCSALRALDRYLASRSRS